MLPPRRLLLLLHLRLLKMISYVNHVLRKILFLDHQTFPMIMVVMYLAPPTPINDPKRSLKFMCLRRRRWPAITLHICLTAAGVRSALRVVNPTLLIDLCLPSAGICHWCAWSSASFETPPAKTCTPCAWHGSTPTAPLAPSRVMQRVATQTRHSALPLSSFPVASRGWSINATKSQHSM